MDVATWNVNSLRAHLEHVERWTANARPDVVCLQETKVVDEDFPHEAMAAAGYPYRAISGQPTYNGVAILSKRPLHDVTIGFQDGPADPQRRLIAATIDGVRVLNCYVPNGAPLGSDKYRYKLEWLLRLRAELDAHADPASEVLVVGDMNIAPTEADVYDPFEATGQILSTEPEREAFARLTAWGLVDAWRKKNPFGSEYTWWDYRASAFKNNHGFRIDHVLVTRSLLRRCKQVRVDREPRGWDKPSDHAPVVASLRAP